MATSAANVESMEALLLTTDSEFDKCTQPLAERNEIQP